MTANEILIRVIISVILITLATWAAMALNLFNTKRTEPYMVFFLVNLVCAIVELTIEKMVRK